MSEWLVFDLICQIFGLTYGEIAPQMGKRLISPKICTCFCSFVENPVLPKVVFGWWYSFRDTKLKLFSWKYFSRFLIIPPTEVSLSEKCHFSRQMGSEVWVNARERKNPWNHIIKHPIYIFGPIYSFRFDSVWKIWVPEMINFLLL